MTRPEVVFVCPFCGGQATAFVEPEPAVLHTFPTCSRFDRLDLTEFLRAVNQAYQNKTGPWVNNVQ